MRSPRHSAPLRAGKAGREGRPAPPASTCAGRAGDGRCRARGPRLLIPAAPCAPSAGSAPFPPAGEAVSDSPVRRPRAGAGRCCCCRCWFCRRRASGTGLAIPVPVRPPRRYVKCGGNRAESPRAAPCPGTRPAAPGGARALTCRGLPGLPPQRRLSGARPATA